MPQIIEKILNDEFLSVTYKAIIDVCGSLKCFQAIARKTYYGKKAAIQNTLFKELTDFDEIVSGDNWNIIQEYAKTSFVIYDFDTCSYTWGKGVEELIGKKIDADDNHDSNGYLENDSPIKGHYNNYVSAIRNTYKHEQVEQLEEEFLRKPS